MVITLPFQIGVGLGKGREGDQLVPWHPLSDLDRADKPPDTGYDPLGMRSLEHFTSKMA